MISNPFIQDVIVVVYHFINKHANAEKHASFVELEMPRLLMMEAACRLKD
jgi:hypothetical protein